MKTYFGFSQNDVCKKRCVVTLGLFDGVHLGHQYLLKRAKEIAILENAQLVVITFRDLPKAKNALITTHYHKKILLEKMGVDILVELFFTDEIRSLSPADFLKIVEQMFPVSQWVVGDDIRFGKESSGDKTFLQQNCSGNVVIVEPYFKERFSSKVVRETIFTGDLVQVSALLGRTYSLKTKGKVIQKLSTNQEILFQGSELCLPQAPFWDSFVRFEGENHDVPATFSILEQKSCSLALLEKVQLPDTLFIEVIPLSQI